MNIRRWAARMPDEFWKWGTFNSYPRCAERYCAVLDSVQGMTTPSNMHFLNTAVQEMAPGECYLEVGTWRGATLIGALLGNEARGFAIDDDTMDDHDEDARASSDVWHDNVAVHLDQFLRAKYIHGTTPGIWERLNIPCPIGVYFFDGDKSTEDAAYDGLAGVLPFLADEAIIIIDDANETTVRVAASTFERDYAKQVVKIIDLPTAGNCWPQWWNGVMALAFIRR